MHDDATRYVDHSRERVGWPLIFCLITDVSRSVVSRHSQGVRRATGLVFSLHRVSRGSHRTLHTNIDPSLHPPSVDNGSGGGDTRHGFQISRLLWRGL